MSDQTARPSRPGRARPGTRVAAAVALCAMVSAGVAQAKEACFTKAEFEAEQAIRLHTELMVVGLTCRTPGSGDVLFHNYRDFTNRHREQIIRWEKTLISFFQKNEKGNATRRLDTMRTEVANEISRRAVLMSPVRFCETMVPGATEAVKLSREDLLKRVGNYSGAGNLRLSSRPLCEPQRLETLAPEAVATNLKVVSLP
ncbi:MAG TPA: hypothetical protein VEY95_02375 [Azospirillaceae bacterium]|nr:hypothetical protein [Azospirillaceae bacterium]